MAAEFHRFEGEYYSPDEWKEMPEAARRVRRALGPEPLLDRRAILPLITVPPPPKPLPPGPRPGTSLLIDLAALDPIARSPLLNALQTPGLAEALRGARLWGYWQGVWYPLAPGQGGEAPQYRALTLTWELTALRGGSLAELTATAVQCQRTAEQLGVALGLRLGPVEAPEVTARRAALLVGLQRRFARSIELRLLAVGAPYSARALWRALYSLGLRWGNLDLFHWHGLFTVANTGKPGYFLPERAAEGEGVPGLSASFELPSCPDPIAVFDRMALLIAYLRETLGGRPQTGEGRELDGERLDYEREQVAQAVRQMEDAGIVPGSADALAFF